MTDLIDVPAFPAPAGFAPPQVGSGAPLPPPTLPVAAAPVVAAVLQPPVLQPEPAPIAAPDAVEPLTVEVPTVDADAAATSLVTGPASILSPDPTMMPLEMSVPALPPAAATPPPNTAAAALGAAGRTPLTAADFDLDPTGPTKSKKKGSGATRALGRLLLVGALSAGGWYAKQHGPELYEKYTSGDSGSSESIGSVDGADAPLAFPTASMPQQPVRTAEFTLAGLAGAPDTTYHVTTDFETNVARVDISRATGPDLEVLTFGDSAFVRKAGDGQWYQLDRGEFPLQNRLARVDWVRRLEELIPIDVRQNVTIEKSSQSTLNSVSTRHLTITVDSSMLRSASMPAVTPGSLPPDQEPGAVVPAADVSQRTTEIEIWVDESGLVRQVSGAPQLGADTITVLRTGADPWVPEYPDLATVLPLTASTLLELGI